MEGLTLEQLKARGGSPTGGLTFGQIKSAQTPVESKPGFFSSLVTDPLKTLVVKPGVRFGQALGNLIAPMLGATPEGIARANQATRTVAGMEIEPQKAFGNGGARQITGDIAKTASYLYTGGQAGTVVNQTLRGQILKGGLTGLKTGAVSGGAYSFGEAIQNAENQPSAVAYQTLFGTVLGGATGGILGTTLPAISAGLTKIKGFKDFESLTGKLNERNREIFKPTSSQLSNWEQAKVNPIETFSREFGLEKIPTANNTLQLDELISQTDLRYKAGSEGFNTILRNSPEVISISQRETSSLNSIEKSTLTPSQKLTAKAKVQSEFLALKDEAQKAGQLLSDDNIPVAYADNLKDRFWGATKYFGPEEASVSNEVNRKIGTAFKEGIEGVVTDTNVREYNKKLQELIYLRDFLESRNGKVPGTGGKMLRYTLRTVGAITGGGGIGSVAGAITADQVAQAIASPTARTWLIRRQLAKLPPEVRKSLEQEAKQILENMAIKRAETLRLPAPSSASLVNQGRPIPVAPSNVEFTGGDIVAQSSKRAISQEANPNPNIIDNTNPIK